MITPRSPCGPIRSSTMIRAAALVTTKTVPRRLTRTIPWQGAETAIRPHACREDLPDPGTGVARLGAVRKRDPRFPRPCVTFLQRPVPPAHRQACARPGGRWPGGFGPWRAWDEPGAVAGAMAPARMRKARADARGSRFSVRQPMRRALFQHPVGIAPCRPVRRGPQAAPNRHRRHS